MEVCRNTKEKILSAAEDLFAEKGFYATTIREITQAAGVNAAAINYHFQTKEHLYRVVIEHRLSALNEGRIKQLEDLCANGQPGCLERILRIAIEPLVEIANDRQRGGPQYLRLLGYLYLGQTKQDRELAQKQREVMWAPFEKAIEDAIADEEITEARWRLRFLMGAVVHHLSGTRPLRDADQNRCIGEDETEKIITCLSAALRQAETEA